jgi:GMP synthase (glutamine-hydrolysing)
MRILHLQCLQDAPDREVEVSSIASAMGVPPETLDVVRPFEAEVPAASLDGASGLTIGGSALSVFYAIPKYREFEELLRTARSRGLPMLGICFGAQAIADVFGGRVIRDTAHAEYGTIEVENRLRGWENLFGETPERFTAQAWHRDRIVRVPQGALELAWSQGDVLQAFAFVGERIWGVQFHPERDMETFQHLLKTRSDPPNRSCADIRAALRPSPDAAALLKRFAGICEEYVKDVRR